MLRIEASPTRDEFNIYFFELTVKVKDDITVNLKLSPIYFSESEQPPTDLLWYESHPCLK